MKEVNCWHFHFSIQENSNLKGATHLWDRNFVKDVIICSIQCVRSIFYLFQWCSVSLLIQCKGYIESWKVLYLEIFNSFDLSSILQHKIDTDIFKALIPPYEWIIISWVLNIPGPERVTWHLLSSMFELLCSSHCL